MAFLYPSKNWSGRTYNLVLSERTAEKAQTMLEVAMKNIPSEFYPRIKALYEAFSPSWHMNLSEVISAAPSIECLEMVLVECEFFAKHTLPSVGSIHSSYLNPTWLLWEHVYHIVGLRLIRYVHQWKMLGQKPTR